jgi:hypothetical protein
VSLDLEAAWAQVDAANATLRWYVGRPSLHEERDFWEMYAFDPTENAKVGVRSREWTAVAPQEVGQIGVVLEMARCLAEISAGRVPA